MTMGSVLEDPPRQTVEEDYISKCDEDRSMNSDNEGKTSVSIDLQDVNATERDNNEEVQTQLDDEEQTIVEAPPDTSEILTSTPNNVLKESSMKNNEAHTSTVSEVEPEDFLETCKDKAGWH